MRGKLDDEKKRREETEENEKILDRETCSTMIMIVIMRQRDDNDREFENSVFFLHPSIQILRYSVHSWEIKKKKKQTATRQKQDRYKTSTMLICNPRTNLSKLMILNAKDRKKKKVKFFFLK